MSEVGDKFDKHKPELLYLYLNTKILNYEDLPLFQIEHIFREMEILIELLIDKANFIEVLTSDGTLGATDSSINNLVEFTKQLHSNIGIETDIIIDTANVAKMGASKYGIYNYKNGIHYSRLINAFLRHLIHGICSGEDYDEESQRPHTAHMIANLLMLDYMIKEKPEFNDMVEKPVYEV